MARIGERTRLPIDAWGTRRAALDGSCARIRGTARVAHADECDAMTDMRSSWDERSAADPGPGASRRGAIVHEREVRK